MDEFAKRVMQRIFDQNEFIRSDDNIFTTPRAEGEVNLVAACRQLLVDAGLLLKVQANFDTNKYIIDASPLGLKAQRFLLNKYWSIQLMSLDTDTQAERFCLLPNGTAEDWLNVFKDRVLPTIINSQLPGAI